MDRKTLMRSTKSELLKMLRKQGKKGNPKALKKDLVDLLLTPDLAAEPEAAGKAGDTKKQARQAKVPKRKPRPKAKAGDTRSARQKVEETKYSTAVATAEPASREVSAPPPPRREAGEETFSPAELPRGYGEDRVVAMVRDPYWIFAYWETTPESVRRARLALGEQGESAKTTLRVYDITGTAFTGENANSHFDVEVGEANNWYINTGWPNRSYCVDIGLLGADGRFETVARSNPAHTPRADASEETDEHWMSLEEEFQRIYAASGGFNVGEGSVELREMMEKQLQLQLASEAVGSLFSMAAPREERGFWLDVNTELIVYGATEPDAIVSIQDRPVKLRRDGTFSVRFSLPDGRQVIPVTAQSADGIEERTITPTVERTTSSHALISSK